MSSLSSSTPSPVPSFASFTTSSSSPSLYSSSTPSASSTTPTSTSTSTSSSSSLTYPTSSSTTTPTSAASSTSSPSTSPAVDQPSSFVTPTTTTGAGTLFSTTVSNTLALTLSSATPSSTTTQSSSSDFFSNTGAVAGTFTVVGLVGIALVIALVMFIIKRHARAEEDAEFFDKNPDFSDPPINRVTSIDDISSSDHTRYGAPPMALPPPPIFYPDHAVQAFQAESFPQPPSHGYPVGYTQQYPAQYIYTPEDYDIGYPPVAPHGNPNPHGFAGVQVESAPAPRAPAVLPDTFRPPTKSTLTVPAPRADSRFSVDSFYAGIAQDSTTSTGQAV